MKAKLYTAACLMLSGVGYLVLLPSQSLAQGGQHGYFLKAEKLLTQQKYTEAAQYYEKYLASERSVAAKADPFAVGKKIKGQHNGINIHHEAVYHLAESYRLSNDYTRAEKYYKEATGFPEKFYPASLYWYGVTLRANQKYGEAITAISTLREKHEQMDALSIAADKELLNLTFIKEQLSKSKPGFFVDPLVSPTNSAAYALVSLPGDTMVFTAIQKGVAPSSDPKLEPASMARLYTSVNKDGRLEETTLLTSDAQNNFHDGMAAFAGNKKMFFTRWTDVNGKPVSVIYESDKTATGWSKPVKMGELINAEGSSNAQPFVTPDGKYLLFSSNREGGIGKYDIWYAELDSNFNVLLAGNMGNVINTIDDEYAPSYHQLSRTLLFSSNGRTGMGGFDIYYTRGSILLSDWNQPANAGSPINSSKDDLYYISTDADNLWNTATMSSDRDTSSCCLAMYTVRQDNKQYISGSVIDCTTQLPLADVELSVKDKTGKLLRKEQTNADGSYRFELSNTSRFSITAEKKRYEGTSKNFVLRITTGSDSIVNESICLNIDISTYADSLQQLLDNLAKSSSTLAKFGYNKSKLNGSFVQLDSLALIMKQFPSIDVEIGGYTDTKGTEEYNLVLAQKRVDACIQYLVKKGVSKDRLFGKAYGECCPIEPETIDGQDNPAAREANRRVEYKLLRR